jgi:hypothetical protein
MDARNVGYTAILACAVQVNAGRSEPGNRIYSWRPTALMQAASKELGDKYRLICRRRVFFYKKPRDLLHFEEAKKYDCL